MLKWLLVLFVLISGSFLQAQISPTIGVEASTNFLPLNSFSASDYGVNIYGGLVFKDGASRYGFKVGYADRGGAHITGVVIGEFGLIGLSAFLNVGTWAQLQELVDVQTGEQVNAWRFKFNVDVGVNFARHFSGGIRQIEKETLVFLGVRW